MKMKKTVAIVYVLVLLICVGFVNGRVVVSGDSPETSVVIENMGFKSGIIHYVLWGMN